MEKFKKILKYIIIVVVSFFSAGFFANLLTWVIGGGLPYFDECVIQEASGQCKSLITFLPDKVEFIASRIINLVLFTGIFVSIFKSLRNRWRLSKLELHT